MLDKEYMVHHGMIKKKDAYSSKDKLLKEGWHIATICERYISKVEKSGCLNLYPFAKILKRLSDVLEFIEEFNDHE